MNAEQLEEWRQSLHEAALKTNVAGCRIPPYMVEGMVAYIVDLAPPDDFLTAIFSNDLVEAALRADSTNLLCLPAYAGFLYAKAPRKCWGSPDTMKEWINQER